MITQIERTSHTWRLVTVGHQRATTAAARPRGWLARGSRLLRARLAGCLAARRSADELARLGDALRADVGLPPQAGHPGAELRFIPRPEWLLTRSSRMTTGSGWFGGPHG